jgi:Kef-type K+ transport system membrane component KefB
VAVTAEAPSADLGSLVLILLASTLAALVSRVPRRVALPTVIVEIGVGIVIGPQVLGWAQIDSHVQLLANFGLALLFFFAGLEVIQRRVPTTMLRRGSLGWAISISIALAVCFLLQAAGLDAEWWLMAVALATTSLGTLMPILADAGVLRTRLGRAVLGTGVAGEFWPIVVISVFLTSAYGAAVEIALLVAFGALVIVAVAVARRARPPLLIRVLQETLYTTGQAGVRGSLLILAVFVFVAVEAGFDFVLGAFASGLVIGLVLDSPDGAVVRTRLEGLGYGCFIPVYFVVTGMSFDLDSLLSVQGLALALLFLGLLLVVRGASALLWLRDLRNAEVASLALFGGTGLPLIVAIVGIGIATGGMSSSVGASLIGAGMLSVLLFPLIAVPLAGGTLRRWEADEADAHAPGPETGQPGA